MASNNDPYKQVAELRAAVQRAIPLLSYAAGKEAADNPDHAAQLMAATEDMTALLIRTATS
ncbi:hypothetical protein ACWCPT_29415 [Streptomyces sp. NPDC002308]